MSGIELRLAKSKLAPESPDRIQTGNFDHTGIGLATGQIGFPFSCPNKIPPEAFPASRGCIERHPADCLGGLIPIAAHILEERLDEEAIMSEEKILPQIAIQAKDFPGFPLLLISDLDDSEE